MNKKKIVLFADGYVGEKLVRFLLRDFRDQILLIITYKKNQISKIAENAQEIHTMETSLCYLLEKINLTNVFVYSKYTAENGLKDNFEYIKENYSKHWEYMD